MFLDLPAKIYRRDPFFCIPARQKTRSSIFREDFSNRQEMFVAVRNGRPVARLLTRTSSALSCTDGKPYGMIGFFEAENDVEAAHRLFDRAIAWLKKLDSGTIIGPIDGDTWHSYRLNIGPFSEPPFLMEPYNPPYYRQLWESYGNCR